MTEKRFTFENDGILCFLIDNLTGNKTCKNKEIVDLLNEINDENEQLKKELEMFKPVMFQDMRKGTVILYKKGDVE